jgi:hypothetical protein
MSNRMKLMVPNSVSYWAVVELGDAVRTILLASPSVFEVSRKKRNFRVLQDRTQKKDNVPPKLITNFQCHYYH